MLLYMLHLRGDICEQCRITQVMCEASIPSPSVLEQVLQSKSSFAHARSVFNRSMTAFFRTGFYPSALQRCFFRALHPALFCDRTSLKVLEVDALEDVHMDLPLRLQGVHA